MRGKVSGFPQMKMKNQEHPQWSETSTLNPDVDPIVVSSNVGVWIRYSINDAQQFSK